MTLIKFFKTCSVSFLTLSCALAHSQNLITDGTFSQAGTMNANWNWSRRSPNDLAMAASSWGGRGNLAPFALFTNAFWVDKSISQGVSVRKTGHYRLSFDMGFRSSAHSIMSLGSSKGGIMLGGNQVGLIKVTDSGWKKGSQSSSIGYEVTKFSTLQDSVADGTLALTPVEAPYSGTVNAGWTTMAMDVALRAGLQELSFSWSFADTTFMLDNVSLVRLPPLVSDTQSSMALMVSPLRGALALRDASTTNGLANDCTVYNKNNTCVSFVGSKSDGSGFAATTGALILSHKLNKHFRLGGYLDQASGSSTSGNLTLKRGEPGLGVFGEWSQNLDGSGVRVRAAANMGKVDMVSTREEVETAEAGKGQSNIKSKGFQLEISHNYAINEQWSALPYVGYRRTSHTRAGYTEEASDDVIAPLTYNGLRQSTQTLTAGATFAHTLSARTTIFVTAGLEHDLKRRIDAYQATNSTIGNIQAIGMGAYSRRTRPTVSVALNHEIDRAQRVGVSLSQRQEAFASGATTSAFVQYSKGF